MYIIFIYQVTAQTRIANCEDVIEFPSSQKIKSNIPNMLFMTATELASIHYRVLYLRILQRYF